MLCAVSCYEGLGDLERAELWVRRLSERYPTSWSEWFLWCKRTGRGDVDAARELADRVVDAQPDRFFAGQYHALAGRPDRALEELKAAFQADPSPMNAGGLILMADAMGEVGLRDETLSTLCDEEPLSGSGTAQLFRPLRAALFADPPGPIDVAEIDGTIEEVLGRLPGGRGSYEFIIGQLLRRHGHPLEGMAYLRRCLESEGTYPIWRVVAARDLREAGVSDPAVALAGRVAQAGR
jgi:tetratricopeptide (TPR) repeat protein